MSEESPNYYAVIPATVRYDPNLVPNAKLLYGEITALANKKGFCWARNRYFADLYGVSLSSISRWISQLELGGFIKVHIERNNRHEVVQRSLRITEQRPQVRGV